MDRVDTMIKWLTNDTNPPNLVMFYSEQPDKLAHIVGPNANNVSEVFSGITKTKEMSFF